jgi:hypothetical protein
VAASMGTQVAAPFAGMVFQLSSLPVVYGQGAAGQHLADQLFQALVHGTANLNDPALVATFKDAAERVLAGRLMLSSSDNLENLNWDAADSDVDWQLEGEATAWMGRRGRRNVIDLQTTPPQDVQHRVADEAALDQYFAQTADDSDQTAEDE